MSYEDLKIEKDLINYTKQSSQWDSVRNSIRDSTDPNNLTVFDLLGMTDEELINLDNELKDDNLQSTLQEKLFKSSNSPTSDQFVKDMLKNELKNTLKM